MTELRTLILLRHAKAATPTLAMSDEDRPLTERGERDAERAGEELRILGLEPEVVLCSPARRTRRTAELAFPGVPTRYEPEIYLAYPEGLLERLRRQDPDLHTLALCGHNPAVHELATMLTGGDHGFRPGTFAVIRCAVPWPELSSGEGELIKRWDPKLD
ncbi:SixA phosphatase family protein [Nonomuraea sp. NPDC048826]|uniref:SixA phosphatase family protein n=1 Tax=Nonomuraea sp. NPDC048826 TaxID=3364347 RepID=UPI0037115A30